MKVIDQLKDTLSTVGASPPLKPLTQIDNHSVQFWFRKDFAAYLKSQEGIVHGSGKKGKTDLSNGLNVATRYVEDKNGKVVHGSRVRQMNKHLGAFFHDLKKDGQALRRWSEAGADIKSRLNYYMEHQFPELCLCENHWKVQMLATSKYSSFYDYNIRRKREQSALSSVETPSATKQAKSEGTSPFSVTSSRSFRYDRLSGWK